MTRPGSRLEAADAAPHAGSARRVASINGKRSTSPASPGFLTRVSRALRRLLGAKPGEELRSFRMAHLSLPAPASVPPSSSGPDITDNAARLLEELNSLMSAHPQSRQVMRQLAFVEKALIAKGPRILDELPVHVLMRGKHQLTSLCEGELTPGLAELNSAMAASLSKRAKVNASAMTMKGPPPTTPGLLSGLGSTGFPMIAAPVHVDPRAFDLASLDDRDYPEFHPTQPFEEMPAEPDLTREPPPRRR